MKSVSISLLLTLCIGCGNGGGRWVWYNPNNSLYEAVQDSRKCRQEGVLGANVGQVARHQERILTGTQNQGQVTFQDSFSRHTPSQLFRDGMHAKGYRRVRLNDLSSQVKTMKLRVGGRSETVAGK